MSTRRDHVTDLRRSVQALECPRVLVSWGVLGPRPPVHRDYLRFGGVRLYEDFQAHPQPPCCPRVSCIRVHSHGDNLFRENTDCHQPLAHSCAGGTCEFCCGPSGPAVVRPLGDTWEGVHADSRIST